MLLFMLMVKNLIVLKKILKDEVDEICCEVIDNEEVNNDGINLFTNWKLEIFGNFYSRYMSQAHAGHE